MKLFFLLLTNFFLCQINYGHNKDSAQFKFESEDRNYNTKDTIRISYDLDSLEILHSNFGYESGNAVFSIICHSDSLLTRGPQPSCDYLLMEYTYSDNGNIEIVIDTPGVYSVMFFIKNKGEKEVEESNLYKKTLETPKFKVIARNQE